MSICFKCQTCKRLIRAPKSYAGRNAVCPGCSTSIVVPDWQDLESAPPEKKAAAEAKGSETSLEIGILDWLHQPSKVIDFLDSPEASVVGQDGTRQASNTDELSSDEICYEAEVVEDDAPRREPASSSVNDAPPVRENVSPRKEKTESPKPMGEWLGWMLNAFLDPRSIQWLLTLGGGLMVLGLLIWLISEGIFSQPIPLAILFGTASIGVLVASWFVTLYTRFKLAGRALAFLSCVVLPLNLWFYHSQELLLIDQGLWVAAVVCVVMYLATVLVLRDAVFLYAVEAGVTLTAILLLGSVGQAGTATNLSLLLVSLGCISIHLYYAFPATSETFDRSRFGLAVFWSGHLQLLGGLSVLLMTQLAGWLQPLARLVDMPAGGVLLTNSTWASGLIWLVAAYLYFSSDLLIRKIGVYIYAGALCLVMAEVSLLGVHWLGVEGVMALLALTACGVSLTTKMVGSSQQKYARVIAPLALLLSIGPVLLGLLVSIQSNVTLVMQMDLAYEMTWKFVGAALVVAVANRVSALLFQGSSKSLTAIYIFFSAAALCVAVAGGLELAGFDWLSQIMILMLIPMGYLVAARLWRGRTPELPVEWVAQITTVLLLAMLLWGVGKQLVNVSSHDINHLMLSIAFLEVALFYVLASALRYTSRYSYFATAALCMAIWQALLHFAFPQELLAALVAMIGLGLILVGRMVGVRETTVYRENGDERGVQRGPGLSVVWLGHGALTVALLVALLSGLAKVSAVSLGERELALVDWLNLGLVTLFSAIAAGVSPRGPWNRIYTVATIGMASLVWLAINVAVDLTPWRKIEIFLVVLGCFALSVSYVARFREVAEKSAMDAVTFGLWFGSMLVVLPLLFTVFHHWATLKSFSTPDEFALITLSLLLLITGYVWQVKASTIFGGGSLFIYLAILVISLVYRPQVAIGIYLAAGGGVLFGIGLALAIYRERLIKLPEVIAKREGIFRVMGWR